MTVQLRSFYTGRTLTCALVGRSGWDEGTNGTYVPNDWRTGSALEDALRLLSDSLATHRSELSTPS
jgi:hypothetical protein